MTPQKIREAIDLYRTYFETHNVKKQFPLAGTLPTQPEQLAHCHDMLDAMEMYLDEGRIEKVFRWLGFIQGVLWSNNVYTIEQLTEHNRHDATEEPNRF